jgi:hypothetical protein
VLQRVRRHNNRMEPARQLSCAIVSIGARLIRNRLARLGNKNTPMI